MLLRGLTWLVLFQLLGTAINHLFVPFLPGPIIGLLLLLLFLMARGEVGKPLNEAASSLLRYLPLLLVPCGSRGDGICQGHCRRLLGDCRGLADLLSGDPGVRRCADAKAHPAPGQA